MTRKDYILIAEAIREVIADIDRDIAADAVTSRGRTFLDGERMGAKSVATRLAIRLRSENDRFDVGRFMDAAIGPVA